METKVDLSPWLAASIAKRHQMIPKDRAEQIAWFEALALYVYESGTPELKATYNRFTGYLYDTGSPLAKMLEHLASLIPETA